MGVSATRAPRRQDTTLFAVSAVAQGLRHGCISCENGARCEHSAPPTDRVANRPRSAGGGPGGGAEWIEDRPAISPYSRGWALLAGLGSPGGAGLQGLPSWWSSRRAGAQSAGDRASHRRPGVVHEAVGWAWWVARTDRRAALQAVMLRTAALHRGTQPASLGQLVVGRLVAVYRGAARGRLGARYDSTCRIDDARSRFWSAPERDRLSICYEVDLATLDREREGAANCSMLSVLADRTRTATS